MPARCRRPSSTASTPSCRPASAGSTSRPAKRRIVARGPHRHPAGPGQARDERVGHPEAERVVGLLRPERAEGQDGEAARRGRRRPHRAEEAVAAPRDRLDPGAPVGLLPEGLAEDRDVDAEVGLLDERVRPDPAQQLVLRHDLARFGGQHGEELGGLRRHVEERVSLPDEPPRGVEPVGAELENRRPIGHFPGFYLAARQAASPPRRSLGTPSDLAWDSGGRPTDLRGATGGGEHGHRATARSNGFERRDRHLAGLTARAEKRALLWLAPRTPGWVTSDHLTLLGLLAMAACGALYALAGRHPWLLLLVNAFLALNWLGDSLDGTLARYRQVERPRFGFYVDHLVDAFGALLRPRRASPSRA